MLTAISRLGAAAVLMCTLLTGCARAPVVMRYEPLLPSCRTVVPPDRSVLWISPFNAEDHEELRSWCDAVGPVVLHDPGTANGRRNPPLTIVSWNMAVGDGRLLDLINEVRSGRDEVDIILLLQEAYRAGTLPDECPAGSGRSKALGLPRSPDSQDIVQLATRLGMHAVYAPSMRNGVDCRAEPREDRGNAILSTVPLSRIAVIELPFAQERRVAIAAIAHVGAREVGIISTHFDTWRHHRDMGKALAQTIELLGWKERYVIGGDFNSGLPLDTGIREMRKHFTEVDCGRGPTHTLGTRLDHMFIGASDKPFACRTGMNRYGSDHSPLIADLPPDS